MIESPQGGNPGDPRGNKMEKEEMKEIPPIGQYGRCRKAWERVLVVAKGFQEIRTPAKNDVPARDTKTCRVDMYNVRWTRKLGLLSLISAVNNNVYQQESKY
jgi:hypothetical protein